MSSSFLTSASAEYGSLDFALRMCESIAFSLHSVLGITEPWTGCLRTAFKDEHNSMPIWFWPIAGILLAITAALNLSSNPYVVLGCQIYISAFHCGGIYYHMRLNHHPASGVGPGMFVLLALIVMTIRTNFIIATGITIGCAILSCFIGTVLVKKPPSSDDSNNESSLLN